MCDCAEEKARRQALERKRLLEEGDSATSRGGSSGSAPGVSWFSVLGGTLLLALFAVAVKTGADPEGWAKPLYVMLGLHVEDKGPCGIRIDDKRRKWPLEDKKYE
ncbi:uncharacterized protein LOC135088470 [Ostrinia nubilalis]|uniref:uncharacterized protein LOC135088470 n=1 Tax=Ostrinia nubilalis TaxID=29057 RepID=UPI0030826456